MKDSIKNHAYYNNKFFAKWARLYDYEKYFLFPIRKKATQLITLDKKNKILDVATGTGAQAYEFAKLGHSVIGVDLSKEMLLQAKKKCKPGLNLVFKQADGTTLPYNKASFDVSSISLALHDMPFEIGVQVLKEMKRVTKKGGYLIIIDYMEPRKHLMAKFTHPLIRLYETPMYTPFINKGLDSYLKLSGLKLKKFDHFFGIVQYMVIEIGVSN